MVGASLLNLSLTSPLSHTTYHLALGRPPRIRQPLHLCGEVHGTSCRQWRRNNGVLARLQRGQTAVVADDQPV